MSTDPFDHDQFSRVLGETLKTARRERHWFRRDLAHHLGLDLSLETLATYESGTRHMSVVRLIQVCHALQASPIDVLRETYEHVFANELTAVSRWTVDLEAAAQLTTAELAPLRQWAAIKLQSLPRDAPRIVDLQPGAVNALAELCQLDRAELARHLPLATSGPPDLPHQPVPAARRPAPRWIS